MLNAGNQPIQKECGGDEEIMIKIEAGGHKKCGREWDDRGKSDIIQIFISQDESNIESIQLVYVENEKVLPPKRIGQGTGSRLDTVDLNYPSEFLTWVSGSFVDKYDTDYDGNTMNLKSITFGTNQGTYGPFGVKSKKEFWFRMGDRRTFAGFHGTYNNKGICSIGVYIKPITIVNSGLKPGPSQQIKEENN